MRFSLFIMVLWFLSLPLKAQESHVLYLINTVPIKSHIPENLQQIPEDAIAELKIIDDPEQLLALGYHDFDTIYKVSTKAYLNRPESIKHIPTTKKMLINSGLYYSKGEPVPYTGNYINYHLNGYIQSEGQLVNGRKHGTVISYTPNNKLAAEIKYRHGLRDGFTKLYFEDGHLKAAGKYKNSKRIGTWYQYYPNRQIQNWSNYNSRGKKEGEEFIFYPSGFLAEHNSYKNGVQLNDGDNRAYPDDISFTSLERKQTKNIIKHHSKRINSGDASCEVYYNRALAYLYKQNYNNSIDDFNKAIELSPDFAPAYYGRALAAIIKNENSSKSQAQSIQDLFSSHLPAVPSPMRNMVYQDLKTASNMGFRSAMLFDMLRAYKN